MSLQHLWRRVWSFPALYHLVGKVQVIHHLIYEMWLHQVDSFITLYSLQVSFNRQYQFGYLEILYDLVNSLLVRTYKYRIVYVQSTLFALCIIYTCLLWNL